MIHWYVCIITFLFVELVVLTNMETAGGIAPLEECLPLPIQSCELFVISAARTMVSNIVPHATYTDYSLADTAPSTYFRFIAVVSNLEFDRYSV